MLNWCFRLWMFAQIILPLHSNDFQGWNWYKEPLEDESREDKDSHSDSKRESAQKSSEPALWDMRMKKLQKQHEEALSQAIMNPTPQSIELVLKLQKDIMDRAVAFQKVWQQVLLAKGEKFIDPETNSNPHHRKIRENQDRQELSIQLKTISKRFGLFLALKQGCGYCEKFAPIAEEFARTYGFELLGIGDVVESSYRFKTLADNGVLRLINPDEKYPALFLVNLNKKEVWPLAWGLNSLSDLEANARLVIDQMQKVSTVSEVKK